MLLRYLRSLTGFERDARLFLFVTLASGSAVSLWWIDFNLYLRSLGIDPALIGLIATAGSAASLVVAFPASILSDRIGRRLVLLGGAALMTAAFVGLLVTSGLPALFLLAAAFSAGSGAMSVVSQPFLAEHSRADERSELFAVQFAISNGTNVIAALAGGFIAQAVAQAGGFNPQGPDAYRVLIALMAGLGVLAVVMLTWLRDDRPGRAQAVGGAGDSIGPGPAGETGEAGEPGAPCAPCAAEPGRSDGSGALETPAGPGSGGAVGIGGSDRSGVRRPVAGPSRPRASRRPVGLSSILRDGIRISDRGDFARLLLPGFLISLGAGQVIPFLNVFIQSRFDLQLASLNALFAITGLGTLVATLIQPALAHRYGKIGSVVLVQAASIPFIVVLGFSPIFWTVAIAMAVRNSLMNAGNPIFGAFAMERVRPEERATFSAASSLLWALGWVIAGPWYSLLQATLGFNAGYTVNFLTIIVLYTVGTVLYWVWFGKSERQERLHSKGREGEGGARAVA
ncbi:MAG: MFS transporter [Candidatus Limnocylindrales bacterium]